MEVLRKVDEDASIVIPAFHYPDYTGDNKGIRWAAVSYYSRTQLADVERESGALNAASEDYAAARERLPLLNDAIGVHPESLHNNEALADLAMGRGQQATAAITEALKVDSTNPAFLMTAGYVADRAGQISKAAERDAATLASDPGAFAAANDLGVELARQHNYTAAARALRQSIGARSDYALGWFNLGVLYSSMGPGHLLSSQGALTRAFDLDPTLRGVQRQLTIDRRTYRTGLDLSKPLIPHWSFADIERHAAASAAGLLTVLLLALALARSAGQGGGPEVAKRFLKATSQRLKRAPVMRRLRNPSWAVAATVLTLSFPLLRQAGGGATELIAYALGVFLMVVVAMRARLAVARRDGLHGSNRTWSPGVVFGLASGAAGIPWAPLPIFQSQPWEPRVHRAAPVSLAVLAAALFIEAAWLGAPLTRSLAVAALIMTASTIVPLQPLDGARMGKGGALAATGIVGAAVLVLLGVV